MTEENSEKVAAFAPALLKNFMGSRKVGMIFTDKRMIFASVTGKIEKEEMKKAREAAKAEGKGLLGRIAASTILLPQSFEKRYKNMTPADILSETDDNFSLFYNTVEKAILKVDKKSDFEGLDYGEGYLLKIRSSEGKYKLKLEGYFGTVKGMLKEMIPDKLLISR